MRRRAIGPAPALVAVALVLAMGARALADAPSAASAQRFRFVWTRGEGASSCADGRALAQAVATRLGRDPFSEDAEQSIEGVVAHEGERWVARLYRRSRSRKASGANSADGTGAEAAGAGENARVLSSTSPSCSSVDDAAVLAIAIAIDPEHALAPPPSGPRPVAPPAASRAPEPESPPSSGPAAPRPLLERAEVRAQGILAFGMLPGVAPGAEIATAWDLARHLRAELGALALPETHANAGAADSERFAFGLFAGRARACYVPFPASPTSVLALDLCAGAAAGALHSVVFSPVPTEPGERFWAGATAGPRLRFAPAGPLVLALEAEAVLPFVRDRFAVEGQPGTVFQPSAVGMMLAASVGLAIR